MKSIKQQYIDLKEGRMSQANFMRNLRMTFPNLVTNVTSFNDSVKILRNKGILAESEIRMTSAEELAKSMGNYESAVVALEDKMGLSSQEANAIASKIYGEENEDAIMAAIKDYEEEEAGRYTTGGEQFPISEAKTKWENTSGKSMYDQFKEIDNLNGQEVLIGIDYEIEKNHELTKEAATKIVLKNLKKDPYYYTTALMAGTEGYKSEYISPSTKPETQNMTPVKGENFVDKANEMKPVKGIEKPKKDSETATAQKYKTSGISLMSLVAKTARGVKKMDATGEKMKVIKLKEVKFNDFGDPNEVTAAAMQFIASNPTLKTISNDLTIQNSHNDAILRYGYWETLPVSAFSKLEMQFDVEEMYDFDEDTGTITAYRLTPKQSQSGFRPGVDMGSVKESAEDRLAEQISQYIKERFDGMEPVPASLKKMDDE
jgi:hypothetical protein